MSELHLFNPHGSVDLVSFPTDKNANAFFTLSVMDKQGQTITQQQQKKKDPKDKKDPPSVLYGSMPISGLQLDQGVDHSITKTLGNDFLIAEWGDVPVPIVLSGVNFFGTSCGQDWGKENRQVLDFYETYKLSTNKDTRLLLSITENKTTAGIFVCVLTKMHVAGPAIEKAGSLPLYSYTLNFTGVRRKNT